MISIRDLTIQHRLFLPGVIVVLSFVLIAVIYNKGNDDLNGIKDNSVLLKQLEIDLQHFKEDVLRAEGVGKDFRLYGDEQYVDTHAELLEDIHADLGFLQEELDDLQLQGDMMLVQQQVELYEKAFVALVNQRKLIGLNEKIGLRGGMRQAVHAMEDLVLKENVAALTISILQMRRHEKDFLIRKTEKYVAKLYAEQDRFLQLLNTSRLSATHKLALANSIKTYRAAFDDIAISTIQVGVLTEELSRAIHAMKPTVASVVMAVSENINDKRAESAARVEDLSFSFLLTLTLVAVAVLISLIYIANSIIKPLYSLLERMQAIGSGRGDLSLRLEVNGKDETAQLAQAMNTMMDMLSEMISNVRQASVQVSGSTNQIASSMREQEATVSQQAATTHEIAASSKQISATATLLQHNMEGVVHLARHAADSAGQGQQQLNDLEQALAGMQLASGNISSKLGNLSEKAANISQVATTITKVADQTNMLSLNASIEAEKAGEYGRGFSVVAQEIRHLADQTAAASVDIEAIIRDVQASVSEGVMGMDKFSEEIRTGVETGTIVSAQLVQVIEQVQELAPVVDSANESLRDQAVGAEGISTSISELQNAAQQTSDMVSRNGHAIEDLNKAAADMQALLGEFRVRDASQG